MPDIYIPTLHTFAMDNPFTGSCGMLRFKLTPSVVMRNRKEVDMEHSSIRAELWHGVLCYELSEPETEKTFPMSEEGRAAMKQWLEESACVPQDG